MHSAFPDKLQADSAVHFSKERKVLARITEVTESERRRYFIDEADRIKVRDAVAVVSREWNIENIEGILERARELGYAVSVEEEPVLNFVCEA
jgi:hypothetical protein